MGFVSGATGWALGAPVRRWVSLLCRLAFVHGIAIAGALAPLAQAQDSVKLVLAADVSPGGRATPVLPQRVIFVVDGSGSMYLEEAGVERWTSVANQLRADIRALATGGVPVELTVVKFGDRPSSVASPGSDGWSGTLAGAADAPQVASDVVYRLGKPSGTTALFLSMQDAIKALDADLSSGRYSGGQVIIYSDGADSSKTNMFSQYETLRRDSISAVRQLRSRHPLSNVIIRTFGEEARAVAKDLPDIVDLTGSSLPAPPRVTQLSFVPSTVPMAALRGPRLQRIAIEARGLSDELRDGIEVTLRVGDTRAIAQPVSGGWSASIDLPEAPRGLDVEVLARATGSPDARAMVRAPALALPSSPTEWGLPKCGSKWGMTCLVGKPVPLSVRVPSEGVTVQWAAADGAWREAGPAVSHPGFSAPGTYAITVEVRTPDGSRADTVNLVAIDPTLEIEGPSSASVGEAVTFRIGSQSGALASGARAADVRWLVDGRPAGKGAELKTSFGQRGRAMITAEVEISACGTVDRAAGSMIVPVAPVPSVELGDADLVRGAGSLNRLPVRVMLASRVSAVRLSFNGGAESRAVISQAGGSDDATIEVAVPADVCAREGELTVAATPEVKGDDGKVDESASARARATRSYKVRLPNPKVMIDEPSVGQEATFERELPIRLHVEGSDAEVAAVKSVRLQFNGEREQDLPIGSDRRASAAVTPRFATGESRLAIRATALDASGSPVGQSQEREIALRQPKLELRTSADQVRRDSSAPADLTIALASPDGAPGWEAGVSSTIWTVEPTGIASVASETKSKLVLQVEGIGEMSVSAQVRRGGLDERIEPVKIPVVLDPVNPRYLVTELNSTRQVGTVIGERMLRIYDRTEGPVASRQFFLRREGADWEPISAESFQLVPASKAGERVEVRGTFTGLDGATVEGKPVQFLASPGHNWALVAVVGLVCAGVIAASWWLCFNNEFLGAVAAWSADDAGHHLRIRSRIRWLRGTARCSVITKRVRIPLPAMYGDEYAWLADLRKRRAFIEMGGSLASPQLTESGGVGLASGSRHDRVRRTTLQPTAQGAEPVYLSISPSASAAFIGWMSFTATATVVLAVFAFLFFRGYI